jgi:hypothetical protein
MTEESIPPSYTSKVASTTFLVAKELVELGKISRVIDARLGYKPGIIGHASVYHIRWREVNIPLLPYPETLRKEIKMPVTLRIDPDVISWFRNTGAGYQTRMNAVLRAYMLAKRKG